MNEERKKTPTFRERAFYCPHCREVAKQDWSKPLSHERGRTLFESKLLDNNGLSKNLWVDSLNPDGRRYNSAYKALFPRAGRLLEMKHIVGEKYLYCATCQSCGQSTLWLGYENKGKMVYPDSKPEPLPPGASKVVCALYEEAGKITSRSPRAAKALLRTTIEILCKEILGEESENKNLKNLIEETAKKHNFHEHAIEAMKPFA